MDLRAALAFTYPAPVAGAHDPDVEAELARLRGRLKLLQSLVDHVPAMLAYWDANQRCVFANRAYEVWFGVSPDALVGRTMRELLGAIYPLNLPFIEGALRGAAQQFEREIPDPLGGPPRYSQAHYVPDIVDGVVRGFYVLVADITQRRRLEQDLQRAKDVADMLATHDALTGLPNRTLLEDRAAAAIERARRSECGVVLAFLDMDDFKTINDTYGHAAGDAVLRGVAARLSDAMNPWDTLARLGGDEFVLLIPEIADEQAAARMFGRLLRLVREAPFMFAGHPITTSFSLGAALFPRDGDDVPTLLAHADQALYVAKRAGKDRWAPHRRA